MAGAWRCPSRCRATQYASGGNQANGCADKCREQEVFRAILRSEQWRRSSLINGGEPGTGKELGRWLGQLARWSTAPLCGDLGDHNRMFGRRSPPSAARTLSRPMKRLFLVGMNSMRCGTQTAAASLADGNSRVGIAGAPGSRGDRPPAHEPKPGAHGKFLRRPRVRTAERAPSGWRPAVLSGWLNAGGRPRQPGCKQWARAGGHRQEGVSERPKNLAGPPPTPEHRCASPEAPLPGTRRPQSPEASVRAGAHRRLLTSPGYRHEGTARGSAAPVHSAGTTTARNRLPPPAGDGSPPSGAGITTVDARRSTVGRGSRNFRSDIGAATCLRDQRGWLPKSAVHRSAPQAGDAALGLRRVPPISVWLAPSEGRTASGFSPELCRYRMSAEPALHVPRQPTGGALEPAAPVDNQ